MTDELDTLHIITKDALAEASEASEAPGPGSFQDTHDLTSCCRMQDAEEERECFGSAGLAVNGWDAAHCSTILKAVRLAFSRSLTCSFLVETSFKMQHPQSAHAAV